MTIIIKKARALRFPTVAILGLASVASLATPASAQTSSPTPAATPAVASVAPVTPVAPMTPVTPTTPMAPESPVADSMHEAPSAAAPHGAGTTVGGYGEVHYMNVNGPDDGAEIDFHRFVIFLGHRFDDSISFHSELEIEHGGEEVELEQAYLEYAHRRWLGLRGGLLLVPVGILNIHHEPPTFHGVERNSVDTLLVPTTWREAARRSSANPSRA